VVLHRVDDRGADTIRFPICPSAHVKGAIRRTVTGNGSVLDAGGFLGVGKDRDGNLGGTAALRISAGGVVNARINGHGGTIIGTLIAAPGCVISPAALRAVSSARFEAG
jgi:hypothetical protein